MRLLALACLLGACAHASPQPVSPPGPGDRALILVARARASQSVAGLHLEKPEGKAAMQAAIDDLHRALGLDPRLDTATELARAERTFAEAFAGNEVERIAALDAAIADAARALGLPALDEALPAALRLLTAEKAGALAEWIAATDARSRALGLSSFVSARPVIRAGVERLLALDPAAGNGAGYRLQGTLLATEPAAAGGNLGQSRAFFEKARAAAPGYLPNRVAMAASWAVKAQDRVAFEKLLGGVLVAPSEPPLLDNELARFAARKLLAEEAVRF